MATPLLLKLFKPGLRALDLIEFFSAKNLHMKIVLNPEERNAVVLDYQIERGRLDVTYMQSNDLFCQERRDVTLLL